jgi:translation initiation factor IF-2
MEKNKEQTIERPPAVVVMGHIDHGKSTLLDYIRKSNIVDGESGGITQHLSAYEVVHKDEHGADKKITFLDTPGHEAFSKMRARGAKTADIAILVVSAEDSVKAQTLEAWETIKDSGIPYIVAINKIDKPGANVEKTKIDLAEKGIYLENYGGDIPFAEISAKKGDGVDQLLTLVLLVAELAELKGNPNTTATGVVIESHMDPKRGICATLVIKNGTINKGDFVVAGEAVSTTRIMENFLGKPIDSATFSSPIGITGFDKVPEVGSIFTVCSSKRDAEECVITTKAKNTQPQIANVVEQAGVKIIPIVIKTDVFGTGEAIEKEILKLTQETIKFKIISRGVGAISENDLKLASGNKDTVIIGFHTKMDARAFEANEALKITVETFDIIYKITDWLKELIETRRPRVETVEVTGQVKILKTFSATKEKQVVGGKVLTGKITEGNQVRILRREAEIGRGKIVGLQQNRLSVREILEDTECGLMIQSKIEIAHGDILEVFTMVTK